MKQVADRVAVVLRDLVLDRAALDVPIGLRESQILRPRGLHAQEHVEILRGRHEEVLRDLRLRIRIPVAAEQLGDIGDLRLRKRFAAAEHHVLERVRLPRKVLLVGADLIVQHRERHRSERIAYCDDPQTVF